MLSKQQFLQFAYKKHPYFKFFKAIGTKSRFVGRLIKIYFTPEKLSFNCATMAKANYYGSRKFVRKFTSHEFLCVGIERKGLSSTLRVRYVDAGVLVERKFPIFSTQLFAVRQQPLSGVNKLGFSKAKLYYFNQRVIRKHLNLYYYS